VNTTAFFYLPGWIFFIKYIYICYMKFLSTTFLILFIAFLATPTLIGMVDNQVDTSYFYSLSEEEESQTSFDEINFYPTTSYLFINFSSNKLAKLNVLFVHDLSFDNLAHQIFSPPPNFI
jgi:hypothetical protein